MALVKSRPLTPGTRFLIRNKAEVSKKQPERQLTTYNHKKKGRNCYGRITSRRRGGGHKRAYRIIDFRRDKLDIPANVQAIEYDPNRSANIALLAYADGEKRYILAPRGVKAGDSLINASQRVEFSPGYSMPLAVIPPATKIHAIELHPGRGAQIARSAGQSAQLVSIDGDRAVVKLPSGEIRFLNARCRATIGEVGNHEHGSQSLGKAGRNRWLGRRPRVRGVAMNPVDHPMGGGEGKTSGGGHPQSPWGQLSKGFPTRKKANPTNSQILVRRNGRQLKKK
ncbi:MULTISPECIES: 50S ribosomal protein L2 [unclassified Lentimonas]|uniref:50S ribosomal protein L2 n=1 Tax=unclassified Lentimonas TaxID=2630993 RepID=UPI001327AB3B|nr:MULTISPECIES: 50S ribosomal protein L2 [unclassified Lentimonas]CAA6677488.1 LSU ribosomal protein L2p (L8e) [Lentimonas sp. CC4]CAA6686458.1 LSU ribosomal protein L2p (L8e) [Lentimonas sp. CC6]CAA6690264.1 LSU ribosomal protein L2p (L8e) [Lentimonas sp. CC19]CAA6690810.1 LSU ribosomal protein L2p (L8e) [Lentimonas sp. CC10]CAA7068527.1 LSU ribosomal protein L2p (L8e) [Lentimonas sp. CC11]